MIPIIWHHLQVHQDSPHPPRLQEETWRTGGALTGFLLFLSFSGTSTSSKTPGRDLEDRWCLNKVSDFGSWWNFHRSFWSMIPFIWHHLQVHQETPCPPRLQEETWRTGEILTSDNTSRSLDWVCDVGSWWNLHRSFWSMIPIIWHLQVHQETPCPPRLQGETWRTSGALTNDTTSRIIRNLHNLQDSRERLGGQVEPWQSFCCFQVYQEPPHPPRLQGETWRKGGVLTGFLMLDLDETFTKASEVWSLSYDTTSRFIRILHILQDSRKRLEGQVEPWQGFCCF